MSGHVNRLAGSLLVDFGCERRCQTETDLDGVRNATTLRQLMEIATDAHDEAHLQGEPRYVHHDTIVRASALVRAA